VYPLAPQTATFNFPDLLGWPDLPDWADWADWLFFFVAIIFSLNIA
jgi:hypothetical protein